MTGAQDQINATDSRVMDMRLLLTALFLFIILWMLHPQVFNDHDPWAYSLRAHHIASEFSFGGSHVFAHRLGLTVPVAVFYKLFGVSIVTTNLWPLCAALLIIFTVWAALPDSRSRSLGLLLCVISVPLLKSSTSLHPDIVATSFMSSACLMLFSREALLSNGHRWSLSLPVIFIALLFTAFLTKLTAYWVLPLWVMALFSDARHNKSHLIRRFHTPALCAGIIMAALYLFFCHEVWGDAFSRFKSIEALTGQHLWSAKIPTTGAYVQRLVFMPLQLFLSQYGAILLLAMAALMAIPKRLKPWAYYSGCCLFFFCFGTTSLSSYAPMPLVGRMTMPALPGLIILAAFFCSRITINTGPPNLQRLLPFIFGICIVFPLFTNYLASWKGISMAEHQAMSVLKKEIAQNPDTPLALVCSDERSPKALRFYFAYQFPSNLAVLSVKGLSTDQLAGRRGFVYINRVRSKFLQRNYRTPHHDREINSLGLPIRFRSKGVYLYEFTTGDRLAPLTRGQ